jgi:outer membrane receptor protein involved in Fe transport
MRLDPFGEEKGPATNTMNLRLTKAFRVTATSRMGIELNLYNVLNSNAATATTYVSGPTYGYVTEILPPRIVRVGLKFDF